MKLVKRFFILIAVLIFIVLAAAVAIPYFYKDEIVDYTKTQINDTLDAKVDFDNVGLSLISSFPNFSLNLDNIKVEGVNEFEGIPLANIKELNVTLDVYSVMDQERPIEVKAIYLTEPNINIQVLRNGKANYDITKSTATEEAAATEGSDFLVQLEQYEIENGNFVYNDKSSGVFMELKDLDHTGKGDFTASIFDLATKSDVGSMTLKSGGTNYIYKAQTELDATFNIDLDNSKYTLKDNDLRLNALHVLAEGYVQMVNDDIKMDLKFDAPSNQFKDLLSLIPGAYTKGYENVKANGQVKLNGFVKGTYNGAKDQMPAFKWDVEVKDGDCQYPDLPMGIQNINLVAAVNSPSSDFDKMTIDIPEFTMKLGDNPFEARLKLSTPMSDPNIDTKVKGKIQLEDLAKAFPMEGVQEMTGLVLADFTINSRMSTLDKGDYENVAMAGDVDITNMNYTSSDMPPVRIDNLKMNFTPKFVQVDNFTGKLGKSDLQANGKIDNILAYFSPEKTMKGSMTVRSKFFDANEWLAEESTNVNQSPTESPAEAAEVFDRFDFTLDAEVGKIVYDVYEMTGNSAKGNFTPSKMRIDGFTTKIGDSDVQGKGLITNVFNYLFEDGILGGNIDMTSNLMDLNQFMEEEPSNQPKAKNISNKNIEEELDPILVPENIEMDINTKIKKLIYTNMEMKNVNGKLVVADKQVRIKNGVASTLGGKFKMDGGYNTKDEAKPSFDLKYTLQGLDVQKSFNTFNSMKMLAPIAEFIQGKFNTTMSLKGVLGKDMMPDLTTLSADGVLETINAIVNNFEPLEKIGNTLDVSYFKKMELKNTKNWFSIEDGMVILKESPLKVKDIDMKVSGRHGITEDMNYNINARIPRKLLENKTVAAVTNKGLGFLNKEAKKYGLDLKVGDFINVLINITGSIKKPKISIKPLGSDGKTNLIESVKENVTAQVKEVVEEKKEEVKKVVEEKKEDYKAKADAEVAKIMAAAKKQSNRVKSEAKKNADRVRDRAYAEADKQVEKIKNPLQKLAAKKAAELAKKQADKVHKKGLNEANKKADAIMTKAEQESEKVRQKYKNM